MTNTLTSFTDGDLVISISGDGDGSSTYTDNQATPITLEEVTTSGSVVGQLVLPQTTTVVDGVTEYAISGEYGSSSEGQLSLSEDGQSLVIGGYGVNAATYNAGGAAVYGDARLAQSTSLTNTAYTPVARVVADISYDGSVDTSTALYNVFNTNNIRSVATVDGTSFYVAGQGVKGDTTQGVFYAKDGSNTTTPIDTSTDVRDVEIVNGELYVSRDSKIGTNGTSNISTYGTLLPVSATTAQVLPNIDGSLTLTTAQENTINASDVGTTVNLSPESYFFANPTTLYVADSGNPKQGGLGDGGLQKWSYNGTAWVLDYTLSNGLNLVSNTSSAGTTGLIGLTGKVVGDTVELYATNATINDLDQTYLYGITDTLSATTAPAGESFTTLVTAAPDTNIRGVSFAPTQSTASATSVTVSSGSTLSGYTVTSGSVVTVASGGILENATILSGGTVTVSAGGVDSGTTLGQGSVETVLGTVSGDQIEGAQILSAATAAASNETVYNGGSLTLGIKGATASGTVLENGGTLAINGNATATNTTISSGGTINLESPKATLAGSVVFNGSGTLELTAISSAGYGDLAVISGFSAGDVIDETVIGTGASLTTTVSGGNTVETITSGGVSQSFILAGTSGYSGLALASDGGEGVELAFASTTSSGSSGGGSVIVSSGVTSSGLVVSSGQQVTVEAGGTITGATILSGGNAVVAGTDTNSVISSGGNELVTGSASGDVVSGVQLVSATNATVSNETVYNGGEIDLYLKTTSATDITLSGGGLNINGNAFGTDITITNGGLIDLQSPKANITGTLVFSGAGTLEETDTVSAGYGVAATITGFGAGDVIDVTVMGADTVLTSAVVSGNTVETLTSGSVSESFTFSGLYTENFFKLSSDNVGGVMITADGTPCYCPGTLITTTTGDVPVEELQIGDLLVTASGAARPIHWIGRRAYGGRFAAGRKDILPVTIKAGALAENTPRRDLTVSPLHAMFIDGVLIPASALVNGVSVVQATAVPEVRYIHIELETHDVIHAEGALSETFLDDGSRGMFHNAAEYDVLYPNELRHEPIYCAPRIEDGLKVEEIRAHLIQRATGHGSATDVDLELHVDEVTPTRVRGWARDRLDPTRRVEIAIRAGNVALCRVVADTFRADLLQAGIHDGSYSFDVTIAGGLSDAQISTMNIEAVETIHERRCA